MVSNDELLNLAVYTRKYKPSSHIENTGGTCSPLPPYLQQTMSPMLFFCLVPQYKLSTNTIIDNVPIRTIFT